MASIRAVRSHPLIIDNPVDLGGRLHSRASLMLSLRTRGRNTKILGDFMMKIVHRTKLALVAVIITLFLLPAWTWAQQPKKSDGFDLSGGPPPVNPPSPKPQGKAAQPKPRPRLTPAQIAAQRKAAEEARKRREAATKDKDKDEEEQPSFSKEDLKKLLAEELEEMKRKAKEEADAEAKEKADKELEEAKASYRFWIYAGLIFLLVILIGFAIYLRIRQDSFETRVKKRNETRLGQFTDFLEYFETEDHELEEDSDDPYEEEKEPDSDSGEKKSTSRTRLGRVGFDN